MLGGRAEISHVRDFQYQMCNVFGVHGSEYRCIFSEQVVTRVTHVNIRCTVKATGRKEPAPFIISEENHTFHVSSPPQKFPSIRLHCEQCGHTTPDRYLISCSHFIRGFPSLFSYEVQLRNQTQELCSLAEEL